MGHDLWQRIAADAGTELTADQLGRLDQYLDLLIAWNEKINLTRIVDRKDAAMPELDWLIVSPDYQGKGVHLRQGSGGHVAGRLMEQALAWVGSGVAVQLGVIHFNARAIAFYKKWGFEDTGRIVGRHQIPRRLMVRAAVPPGHSFS